MRVLSVRDAEVLGARVEIRGRAGEHQSVGAVGPAVTVYLPDLGWDEVILIRSGGELSRKIREWGVEAQVYEPGEALPERSSSITFALEV